MSSTRPHFLGRDPLFSTKHVLPASAREPLLPPPPASQARLTWGGWTAASAADNPPTQPKSAPDVHPPILVLLQELD